MNNENENLVNSPLSSPISNLSRNESTLNSLCKSSKSSFFFADNVFKINFQDHHNENGIYSFNGEGRYDLKNRYNSWNIKNCLTIEIWIFIPSSVFYFNI